MSRCRECGATRGEHYQHCLVERYMDATGREPARLPADDPLAHQWDYKGSKADRERLADEIQVGYEDEASIIDGQESLL